MAVGQGIIVRAAVVMNGRFAINSRDLQIDYTNGLYKQIRSKELDINIYIW